MDLETEIRELRAQLATNTAEEARLRADADKLVADMRESGVNILADKDAFSRVDEAYAAADKLRDSIAEGRVRLARALEIASASASRGEGGDVRTREQEPTSIIGRLEASESFMRLRESGVLDSGPGGARVHLDPVEVRTRDELLHDLRQRTIDNTGGSGGGLIWSDRLENLIVPMAQRRVRLLDLITIGATDSDTVEFVRQTTMSDNVTGQPYGTSLTESNYGWTKDSVVVKRRGHYVVTTKGVLADSAQFNTLLTSSLQRGHLRDIEQQVYNGDGAGENFLGIVDAARTGVQTVARSTDTYHDAVHKCITKVRLANLYDDYEPTGILINPADWEKIVLEKTRTSNANDYVNPTAAGRNADPATIWGLTPVITTLAPSGSALIGDFSQAVLWLREGVSVTANDSHSDFWLKGLVAVKSEGRAAFEVLQEAAFVTLTGL